MLFDGGLKDRLIFGSELFSGNFQSPQEVAVAGK